MSFLIGCNYWASNAGTRMWVDWDEETIINDLKTLSGHGVRVMRVFPNWKHFQPVEPVLTGGGGIYEYRLEGDRIPENPYWLDEVMLVNYVRGIQSNSKIDSNAIIMPSDMPGYEDKIVMASGSFTQGSSIELSCDGPLRSPYIAYQQGGISYKYGKIIVNRAIKFLLEK